MTQEFKIKPLTKKLQSFIQKNPKIVCELKKGEIKYITVDTARFDNSLYLKLSGFSAIPTIFSEHPCKSPWKYPMWRMYDFEGFLTENDQSSKILALGLAPQTLYEITPKFIQSLPGGTDD